MLLCVHMGIPLRSSLVARLMVACICQDGICFFFSFFFDKRLNMLLTLDLFAKIILVYAYITTYIWCRIIMLSKRNLIWIFWQIEVLTKWRYIVLHRCGYSMCFFFLKTLIFSSFQFSLQWNHLIPSRCFVQSVFLFQFFWAHKCSYRGF